MNDTPTTADAPLARDIPCAGCRYNLRTKRPSERCPECGAPVEPSIRKFEEDALILLAPNRAITACLIFSIVYLILAARFFRGTMNAIAFDDIFPLFRGSFFVLAVFLLATSERKRISRRRDVWTSLPIIVFGLAANLPRLLIGALLTIRILAGDSETWRRFAQHLPNISPILLGTLESGFLLMLMLFMARIMLKIAGTGHGLAALVCLSPLLLIQVSQILWTYFDIRLGHLSRAHPTGRFSQYPASSLPAASFRPWRRRITQIKKRG